MIDCQKIKKLIPEVFDYEADKTKKTLVQTHIEKCRDCLCYYQEIEETVKILRNLPKKPLPSGFHTRLMEKVINTYEQKFSFTTGLALSFALGIALLLFFKGIFISPIKYIPPENAMKLVKYHRIRMLKQGKKGYLSLNLKSQEELKDVKIEILLPEGLILSNGKRKAIWQGNLRKGKNIIVIRVKGRQEGEWYIKGTLKKEGKKKGFFKKVKVI